jgi:peptidyl-prolyl cis-trans isomerase D
MPFAVFRRHQKKMLAIIAVLAMSGFVLSDSLYRLSNRGGPRGGNTVVVDLNDKPVYRSDLDQVAQERGLANRFMSGLGFGPMPFGGYSTRELVDALLLKREADRLGIPDSPEFAQSWLKQMTGRYLGLPMNKQLFDMAMAQLGPDVGGTQVLSSLASQVRLQEAARLGGGPLVTPLDVYQAYRDQNERSSFRFVSFPAANYLDLVGEPTDADVQSLYEKYKDVLPDPAKDTPGFKVPRKVKLEVLTADGPALAKQVQSKLTEADLKAYYDAHKDDFEIHGDLPADLFKDDPQAKLTPKRYTPFSAVKDSLAGSLAKERAQEQITETFDKISRKVDDAADAYHRAVEENDEAKKDGSTRTVAVPIPPSLDGVAKENGLGHEVTPALSSEQAKHYGQIAGASQGSNPNGRGEGKFADVVFAAKSPLYEALEFVDPDGRRFLARKLDDAPAHVAPLDEVRPEVVSAWRLDKARALAEAAAKALVETLKKDGGKFKGDIVDGRPVRAVEAVSKLRSGLPIPGPGLQFGQPTPAELPQIPDAGDALRSAIFDLKPGDVAVQPDAPKSNYYVVTLDRREPATFSGLYGPLGLSMPYFSEAVRDASQAEQKGRLEALRSKAGLKADWVPPDEKNREEDESNRAG